MDKFVEKVFGKVVFYIKSIKNVIELKFFDNFVWEGDKGNIKGDKYDDF